MRELVERLRTPFADAGIIHEAADAIEALSARVEALEAGLERFAGIGRCFEDDNLEPNDTFVLRSRGGLIDYIAFWHFDRARALLAAPADTPSTSSTPDAPRAASSVSGAKA